MINDYSTWKLEADYNKVSKGDQCPRCLMPEEYIKLVATNPDGMNLNCAYRCNFCDETWEGY